MKRFASIRPLLIFWGFLFLFYSEPVSALPTTKILKSEYTRSADFENISVRISNHPEYHIYSLKNPNRIVINFKDCFIPGIHFSSITKGNSVYGYRISQNTPEQTRLVIDVVDNVHYKVKIKHLNKNSYEFNIQIGQESFKTIKKKQIAHKPKIKPILISWLEPEYIGQHTVAVSDGFNTISRAKTFENNTIVKNNLHIKKNLCQDPVENETQKKIEPPKSTIALNNSEFNDDIFDSTNPVDSTGKPWNFTGSFQARGSLDSEKNQTNENQISFKNRTIFAAEYKNYFKISGISDYLYFGDNDQTNDYNLELFEAVYKKNTPNVDISIGRQIKRWGKTDQISPIDTLNPENLTESFIPTYEERKIPIWMADITFKKDNFFIEGVLMPFFEPSKLDYFGTDWAMFSHLKADINDSTLNSSLKTYFDAISVNEKEPTRDLNGFEYAARIGGTLGDVDFGITYHYTFEDLPTIQSFPVKNLSIKNPNATQELLADIGSLTLTNEQVETQYLRTQIFGFEFETIVQDIGLRGEVAFKENESFLTQSLTSVRSPSFFWILGMDYTSLNQWYFNVQFGHQHIYDYDDTILYFEKDNYSLIGEINKDLLSDWLNGSVQYTYMFNDHSYYISPRLTCSYIDNLNLIFGLNLFEGSDNTIFGRYDRDDQIFLDITYHF